MREGGGEAQVSSTMPSGIVVHLSTLPCCVMVQWAASLEPAILLPAPVRQSTLRTAHCGTQSVPLQYTPRRLTPNQTIVARWWQLHVARASPRGDGAHTLSMGRRGGRAT